MGAWGTSLYANDVASDIRDDYLNKLRIGKTNELATQELISENKDIIGDIEEEPLFWFALADTQWSYGRLLPEVKTKALFFLKQEDELDRWKDAGLKGEISWKETREKLREKLVSQQPPEKQIKRYKLYKCKWNLGDVFAYKFTSSYSKEKGFEGKYFIFRKVSENDWWPGHIVPIINVYNWIGNDIPELKTIQKMKKLIIWPSKRLDYIPDEIPDYNMTLVVTSERSIPKSNIVFLGNINGDDLFQNDGRYIAWSVGWESSKYNSTIEHFVIDQYIDWNKQ